MRICHIVGDSKFGGGSKIVMELAGRAKAEGHEVSVVATDAEFAERLAEVGARAVPLDCVRRPVRPLFDTRGFLRLVRHLRAARYDLVHTHTTKAGMIGRLAARLAGTPAVVHTVHGFAFHEQSGRLAIAAIAGLERLAAHWCDRLVTVSRAHRDWALDLGIADADKLLAIPNGIRPLEPAAPEAIRALRREFEVPDDVPLLVALGRLAEQKGFRYLVEAVADLRREGRELRCLIVGEGPAREDLEARIAASGLEGVVRMAGFRRDIATFYGAADLVVQPSLWEGLSISLLEALSLGRPVVTTTIRSNLEVVGDTGAARLVPDTDVRALASAVAELLDDPAARVALGEAAESLYRGEYTIERMLDAYMDLYADLSPQTGGER